MGASLGGDGGGGGGSGSVAVSSLIGCAEGSGRVYVGARLVSGPESELDAGIQKRARERERERAREREREIYIYIIYNCDLTLSGQPQHALTAPWFFLRVRLWPPSLPWHRL